MTDADDDHLSRLRRRRRRRRRRSTEARTGAVAWPPTTLLPARPPASVANVCVRSPGTLTRHTIALFNSDEYSIRRRSLATVATVQSDRTRTPPFLTMHWPVRPAGDGGDWGAAFPCA